MGVESVVRRVTQVRGDAIAEDEGIDAVVNVVRLVLVEREQDDRAVVVESGVREQRRQPEIEPVAREVDGRVVPVVDHVRRDEHPLREHGRVHVRGEVVEVAVQREPLGDVDDGVVEDRRVVLAHVVRVRRRRRVQVVRRRVAALGCQRRSLLSAEDTLTCSPGSHPWEGSPCMRPRRSSCPPRDQPRSKCWRKYVRNQPVCQSGNGSLAGSSRAFYHAQNDVRRCNQAGTLL